MMQFTFTEKKSSHLADPHDPIYQLERQVDRLTELSPKKQLALLYNDALNYKMTELSPATEWYTKRLRIVNEYAALDWLAFGAHLNHKSTQLGNLCTTINQQLQELKNSPTPFSITLFCSTLSKIDHLWHIILPSHLEGIQEPSILALMVHCGH